MPWLWIAGYGFCLVVVGIGIGAMLPAFNAWMIREADLEVVLPGPYGRRLFH